MSTSTRSIARIADQVVDQALGAAFSQLLKRTFAQRPRTSTIARAYAAAVRREAERTRST